MKVLIAYATAGAGHLKAAEAVYQGFRSSPGDTVACVDTLDYTSRFYKSFYVGAYTFLVSRIPWLWMILFWMLGIPWTAPLIRRLRRMQNNVQARAFHRYLIQEQFDCIVTTHFFPTEVAAYLKQEGEIRSKIITTITDFDVHPIWLADGVDVYAAASPWTAQKLQKLGVPAERIAVTGIPIHEKFSVPRDRQELKRRLGIRENVFTILVATGSFGFGPIEEMIRIASPWQAIVVCGHNKDLFFRLSKIQSELVKVYGLVNNMDELMAVSDVMITKPGGLSIAEALANGLPMIFFSAIPGQETNNIKVLREYGVGMNCVGKLQNVHRILQTLSSSLEEYQSMRTKALSLAKPSAVKDIVGLVKYK